LYKQCSKKFQNPLPNVKCEQFRRVNNFAVKIVHKYEQFRQFNFATFSKLFIQSIFYLQIHSLFTVLSCLQSYQGGYLFLSFSQSCQGWKIFLVEITPPVNNFDKKVIFNYKGLDIKLLNINLLNYIELDFLFTARFG